MSNFEYICSDNDSLNVSSSNLFISNTIFSLNLRNVCKAILSQYPIVLRGEVGCGKTYLIKKCAEIYGKINCVFEIHLDDQSDSKSLIGSYICSDVPGKFIWQEGIVSQAVRNGYWLVIEGIEKASLEVIASLATLLDRRKLCDPIDGIEKDAHPDFRIFGMRPIVDDNYMDRYVIPNLRSFSSLWHIVTIISLPENEIKLILQSQFENIIPSVRDKILATYNVFRGDTAVKTIKQTTVLNTNNDAQINKNKIINKLIRYNKLFTLRDIMKVASRINSRLLFMNASGYVPESQLMACMSEIIDVFIVSIRDPQLQHECCLEIGKCWDLQPCHVEELLKLRAPTVVSGVTTIQIGRITLVVTPDDTTTSSATSLTNEIQLSSMTNSSTQPFAFTRQTRRLLERVAGCMASIEPVLLIGETGSGKTTVVQELAHLLKKTLVVQNLSLSTDSSDLIGGYKPVTLRQLFLPSYETFITLFKETFSLNQNTQFLQIAAECFRKQQWSKLLKAFLKAGGAALTKLNNAKTTSSVSQQWHEMTVSKWKSYLDKVQRLQTNLPKIQNGFAFSFADGLLVKAIREGLWLLLDEINLASQETLQALSGVLEGQSLRLLETGDFEAIPRHPDFRIFAAMNPPTDIGKRELSNAMRSRFTEIYVDELTDPVDLRDVVERYLDSTEVGTVPASDIVDIYLACRTSAETNLTDGAGQRPRYSLRSLTRSLKAAKAFMKIGLKPLPRSLYEAFLLNFQTQLADKSRIFMQVFLQNSFSIEGNSRSLSHPPPRPGGKSSPASDWVLVKPFWLASGPCDPVDWSIPDDRGLIRFVLTPTVESVLRDVSCAVASSVAPILLQGPTSVGKTSLIEYLAARTGHICIRINNHDHTDVQEYVGSYVSGNDGQLRFQDGLLVQALRQGHWIILDELNLAPSDVLEALNRLLDDNRELYIPETGETVRPAKGFMLFATQNPPGVYGGRKPLSRAFRNRFIEMNVGDIPPAEVEEIVWRSCGIPPKFGALLVGVLKELQLQRQQSTLFQGRHGAVTTRDLIKWGKRQAADITTLAEDGYMILGERLKRNEEKALVQEVIEKICKVKLNVESMYNIDAKEDATVLQGMTTVTGTGIGTGSTAGGDIKELIRLQYAIRYGEVQVEGLHGVAPTESFRRAWRLAGRAVEFSEPVLLVGETGCGKTSLCQLLAAHRGRTIRILNCHQSTETSDIIGGLRPVRGRETIFQSILKNIQNIITILNTGNVDLPKNLEILQKIFSECNTECTTDNISNSSSINYNIQVSETTLTTIFDEIKLLLMPSYNTSSDTDKKSNNNGSNSSPRKKRKSDETPVANNGDTSVSEEVLDYNGLNTLGTIMIETLSSHYSEGMSLLRRYRSLFEWQNGPLVEAMLAGDMFVLDEINLADDAVIERLNSVLEPGRAITLAEKGSSTSSDESSNSSGSERIVAHPNFRLLATMNPGGDFGKRDLSPALRSRFTEVWVTSSNSTEDLILILEEVLHVPRKVELATLLVEFMSWIHTSQEQQQQQQQQRRHDINKSTNDSTSFVHITITARELIAWANFISDWKSSTYSISNSNGDDEICHLYHSVVHGCFTVLLDGLGIGANIPRDVIHNYKRKCIQKLISLCPVSQQVVLQQLLSDSENIPRPVTSDRFFRIGEFAIPLGQDRRQDVDNYVLQANTTLQNFQRILRGMQLSRPILLEGPPGVGKTSLIATLAALTGHKLVRINLSEHSELSDLLGTDLPCSTFEMETNSSTSITTPGKRSTDVSPSTIATTTSGSVSSKFKWQDGVFLAALKRGDWVLLDELNLAPQTVLEGLNACFDHREEVYLPEIGKSFHCPSSFRVFCAQNPMAEGGGRKGLPQSFLTRFSRVYVETMTEEDLHLITLHSYQRKLPPSLLLLVPKMVRFIEQLHSDTTSGTVGYSRAGSPWEFNLRDVLRWCELLTSLVGAFHFDSLSDSSPVPSSPPSLLSPPPSSPMNNNNTLISIISESVYMLFISRMRNMKDSQLVGELFTRIFNLPLRIDFNPTSLLLGSQRLLIGLATIPINCLLINHNYTTLNTHNTNKSTITTNENKASFHFQTTAHTTVSTMLLGGLNKLLEAVTHSVHLNWPVLLVGQSGSGKKRIVRQLSQQSGNILVEYSASSSTDSTELLGSFEQSDAYRHLMKGMKFISIVFERYLIPPLSSSSTDNIDTTKKTYQELLKLYDQIRRQVTLVVSRRSLLLDEGILLFSMLRSLIASQHNYINMFVSNNEKEKDIIIMSDSYDCGTAAATRATRLRLNKAMYYLSSASKCIENCFTLSNLSEGASFEWIDGVVVEALEFGHWLLLDNANLCSAAVLDRLNSLLEPRGSLLLTEAGEARIVVPHPDFRIFLVMDPVYGEISRAMRNRCVELAIPTLLSDHNHDAVAHYIRSSPMSTIPFPTATWNLLSETYSQLTTQPVLLSPTSTSSSNNEDSQVVLQSPYFSKLRTFRRLTSMFLAECHEMYAKDSSTSSPAPNSALISSALRTAVDCTVPFVSLERISIDTELYKPATRLMPTSSSTSMTVVQSASLLSSLKCQQLLDLLTLLYQGNFTNLSNESIFLRASQAVISRGLSFASSFNRMNDAKLLRSLPLTNAMSLPRSAACLLPYLLNELIRYSFSSSELVISIRSKLSEVSVSLATTYEYWIQMIASFPPILRTNRLFSDIYSNGSECSNDIETIIIRNNLLSHITDNTNGMYGLGILMSKLSTTNNSHLITEKNVLSRDIATSNFTTISRHIQIQEILHKKTFLDDILFLRIAILENEKQIERQMSTMTTTTSNTENGTENLSSVLNSLMGLAVAVAQDRLVIDRSELAIIHSLYTIVKAVDDVMYECIDIIFSETSSIFPGSLAIALKELLLHRDLLSWMLTSTVTNLNQLPWDSLLIIINHLKKSLSKLSNQLLSSTPSCSSCKTLLLTLKAFEKLLCEYWKRPVFMTKARLWKEGGHDPVPRTEENWQSLFRLKSMMTSENIGQTVILPNFVEFNDVSINVSSSQNIHWKSSPPVIQDWLCLLSTFYWAHSTECRTNIKIQNVPSSNPPVSVNIDFEHLIGKLESQLLDLKENHDVSSILDQNEENKDMMVHGDSSMRIDCEDSSTLYFDEKMRQDIADEHARAGDLMEVLLVEPYVITLLLMIIDRLQVIVLSWSLPLSSKERTSHFSTYGLQNKKYFSILHSWLKDIILLGIHYTAYYPELFRELQSLLWSLESVLLLQTQQENAVVTATAVQSNLMTTSSSRRTKVNSKAKATTKTIDDDPMMIFLSVIRSSLCALERRLYSMLSRNINNVSSFLHQSWGSATLTALIGLGSRGNNEGSSSSRLEGTSSTVDNSILISTGAIRILHPTFLDTVLKLVDIGVLLPQYNSRRIVQLFRKSGLIQLTVSGCNNAMTRLLKSFRMSVSLSNKLTESQISKKETLTRIHGLVLGTLDVLRSCRDMITGTTMGEILTILNSFDMSINHSVKENNVQNMFTKLLVLNISEDCLDENFSQLLRSCLNPIMSFLSQRNSFLPSEVDIIAVGNCWVNLGLLRCHLLLPSAPVDPSTKSLIKSDILLHQINQHEDRLAVAVLSSSFSGDNLLTPTTAKIIEHTESLHINRSKLLEKAVRRPSNAVSFAEVYHELRDAVDGLAQITRLQMMLKNIEDCYNTINRNKKHSHSCQTECDKVANIAREEISWQQSSNAFIEKITAGALSGYDDVTSPLLSAIQNISFGLRLAIGWTYSRVQDKIHTKSMNSNIDVTDQGPGSSIYEAYQSILIYPTSLFIPLHYSQSTTSAIDTNICCLIRSYSNLLSRTSHTLDTSPNIISGNSGNTTKSKPCKSESRTLHDVSPHSIFLLTLAKIDFFVGGASIPPSATRGVFRNVLYRFVEAYGRAKEKQRQLAAEKSALYRNRVKEKTFESDDVKEEELALRAHFPDHLKDDFKDILEDLEEGDEDMNDTMDGSDRGGGERRSSESNEAEKEEELTLSWLDDISLHTCATLVGFHARMIFLYMSDYLIMEKRAWKIHNVANGSRGHRNSITTVQDSARESRHQAIGTYSLLAARVFGSGLNHLLEPNLDVTGRGGGLYMLSAMINKCHSVTNNTTTITAIKQSTTTSTSCWTNNGYIQGIDIDLLLLLNYNPEGPNTSDLYNCQATDFHLHANQSETTRATEPLRAVFERASELLVMFPGNELLIQICKIVARILDMHISTPLGKMLASLELLLRKSHEWEQFAASHVSLQTVMKSISSLISRWRLLELKAWEDLLRCKEQSYCLIAMKHWFSLASSIKGILSTRDTSNTSNLASSNQHGRYDQSNSKRLPVWLSEKSLPYSSLSTLHISPIIGTIIPEEVRDEACSKDIAAGEVVSEVDNQKYLQSLFETMDTFLRTSKVGEFPTRLHLIRLFALQLLQDSRNRFDGIEAEVGKEEQHIDVSLREKIGNLLFGIWQYYEQYLVVIRQFQSSLRAPLQQRLKEETKLGRWDELTAYALVEHSERVHRKLNTLLREYEKDVLLYPIAILLQRTVMGGMTTEQGDLQAAVEVPPLRTIFPALGGLSTFTTNIVTAKDANTNISEGDAMKQAAKKSNEMTVSSKGVMKTTSLVNNNFSELLISVKAWCINSTSCFSSMLNDRKSVQYSVSRLNRVDTILDRMDKYLVSLLDIDVSRLPLLSNVDNSSKIANKEVPGDHELQQSVNSINNIATNNVSVTEVAVDPYEGKIRFGKICSEISSELCEDIFYRIESLRKENTARGVKQRAVGDLLRELKSQGISALHSTVPIEIKKIPTLFSSTTISFSCEIASDLTWSSSGDPSGTATYKLVDGPSRSVIDRIECYYIRSLSELNQLRTQVAAPFSGDVSNRDAHTMLALTENMFFYLIRGRIVLSSELDEMLRFWNAFSELKNSISNNTVENRPTEDNKSKLQQGGRVALDMLLQLKKLLATALEANKAATQVANGNSKEFIAIDNEIFGLLNVNSEAKAMTSLVEAIQEVQYALHSLESNTSEDSNSFTILDSLCISGGLNESERNVTGGDTTAKSYVSAARLHLNNAYLRINESKEDLASFLSWDVVTPTKDRMLELASSFDASATTATAATANMLQSNAICSDSAHNVEPVFPLPTPNDETIKFESLLSECVDDCLTAVQRLRKVSDEVETAKASLSGTTSSPAINSLSGYFGESYSLDNDTLYGTLSASMSVLKKIELHKLTKKITDLSHLASSQSIPPERYYDDVTALTQLFTRVISAHSLLMRDLAEAVANFSKLNYVVLRIFRTLLAKGICSAETKEDDDTGGSGEGERSFEDNIDGTGMGEGEGRKDVSDEIENEEQLLGLKSDNVPKEPQEKKENRKLDDKEKDQGVEMTQDFEGEMCDVSEDEEKEDQDEEEDDGKEELDRGMGEVGEEDIVDEKQWDSDEEEDEPSGEEKFEKDSKMKGEKIEDEMRTKDEDEKEGENEKDNDEDQEKEEKSKDDSKDNSNDKMDEKEDKINDQKEEEVVEKPLGVSVREEEEADDGGDDVEDGDLNNQEDIDQEDTKEQKNEMEEENDMNLPDELALDGMEEDHQEDDQDEKNEKEEDETNEMDQQVDQDTMEEEDQDQDENKEDISRSSGGGGLDQEQNQDPEADEDKEEEEEDINNNAYSKPPTKASTAPTFGIESRDGQSNIKPSPKIEDESMDEGKEEQGEISQAERQVDGGEGGDSQGTDNTSDNQGKHDMSSGKSNDIEKESTIERSAPNPFTSKGDINKKWHRRLNLTTREEKKKSPSTFQDEEEDNPMDTNENDLFEYEEGDEGDEGKKDDTDQVLGPVAEGEEQALDSDHMEIDQKKEDSLQNEAEDDMNPLKDEKNRKRDRDEESFQDDSNNTVRRKKSNHEKNIPHNLDDNDKNDLQTSEMENNILQEEDNEEDDAVSSDGSDDVEEDENEDNIGQELDTVDSSRLFTDHKLLERKSDEEENKEKEDNDDNEELMVTISDAITTTHSRQMWMQYSMSTQSSSARLCEQLRLILEPTLASRLHGDYRTGKRINMRRVVGYVASGCRKDKIWLRRSKPAKREYQVMVMMDDSKSMAGVAQLALSSLSTLAGALNRLEVGQLAVTAFSDHLEMLHPFGPQFDDEAGANVVAHLKFESEGTALAQSLRQSMKLFEDARLSKSAMAATVMQLCFVVSDARLDTDNREALRNVVRELAEQHVLVVLVIIDRCASSTIEANTSVFDDRDSIFNTRTVEFTAGGIVTKAYLEDFPFPYYVAIRRPESLPELLSDALRQWFELVKGQSNA